MNELEREFKELVEDRLGTVFRETREVTKEDIEVIARELEKLRKYKEKEYMAVLTYFKSVLLYIQEGKESGDEEREKLLVGSKELVERVIELHNERKSTISKVDTNIITHAPYFAGGSRKRKQQGKKDGYILVEKEGLRNVTYENEKGVMLTMTDAQTLFALFSIWEKQGYQEWVRFTEYQILDTLNLKDGGNQYAMIRNSLEKLWNTSIVMKEAYNIKSGKREITKRFKLIIADKISKELGTKGELRSKNYEIQFSKHINASIEGGYYSLISLAAFNELDSDTARGIYLMMTGINDMDRNELYFRADGYLEIEVQSVYDTLFLESANNRNRMLVDAGCRELVDVGILSDYYFKYKGRTATHLIFAPSDWYQDVIRKKETMQGTVKKQQQLILNDLE